MFEETLGWFYTNFTPIGSLKLELDVSYGDDIDFANDRPATITMFNPGVEWKLTESLVLDLSHRYQVLDIDDGRLFIANLSDVRLNWQLALNSFIRLATNALIHFIKIWVMNYCMAINSTHKAYSISVTQMPLLLMMTLIH